MSDARPTLSAQASTLAAILERVTPHSLHKAALARSRGEGDLIIRNLRAGLETIEWCQRHSGVIRRAAEEARASAPAA